MLSKRLDYHGNDASCTAVARRFPKKVRGCENRTVGSRPNAQNSLPLIRCNKTKLSMIRLQLCVAENGPFHGRVQVSFDQQDPLEGEMQWIGARLKKAREGANFSLQDISDRTRISLRFLTAIENDDFAALPGRVYIFGFTKAYARAVGLDEAIPLAALREKMQNAGID
ncbi:MAG: hypothetical protein B7Y44_02155 [Sphingomonadales bacterium 28-55-16]|nr:MAG: hypothetical protein B7Y44_02155 [Sphingomonadales bacterium 28-55-16]